MRKNLLVMALTILVATAGMLSSCSNDDLETVFVKRSGTLHLTFKDGETAVADTKVRFYNENTENEIGVYVTDANGAIDLGELNEGTYRVELEIKAPKYVRVYQKMQVISGEATKLTVQIADYAGSVVTTMADDKTGEIVKEDIGLGLAFIPKNDALERVTSDEEAIELATEIKYFGTSGELALDLPSADYYVRVVRGDSIVGELNDISIEKMDEKTLDFRVNVNHEKITNKAQWTVVNAVDELGTTIDFPITSFEFHGDDYKMTLNNGVIFYGWFDFYGDDTIETWGLRSSDDDLYSYSSDIFFEFDAQGNLVLGFDSFRIDDDNGLADFAQTNFTVTLK